MKTITTFTFFLLIFLPNTYIAVDVFSTGPYIVNAQGTNEPPIDGNGDNQNQRNKKICKSIEEQEGGLKAELERSIVPCGRAAHQCDADKNNDECQFEHIFILVNNLTSRFISTVFAPLVVIMLVYIGFLFIKEQAAAKAKAKQLLWRLVVGTFFVLAAWLVVNLIVSTFVAEETKKSIFSED